MGGLSGSDNGSNRPKTLEDCRIKPRARSIWDGPAPLFQQEFDPECKRVVSLQELPSMEYCGGEITLSKLYPDFNGDMGARQVTMAGKVTIRESIFSNIHFYKPGPQIVNGLDLESHVLDQFYCHKKYPSKVKDAYLPDFDVPAKVIDLWSKEYIQYKWQDQLKPLMAKYPLYDMATLYELNLVGADLWSSLMACYEGNAELARQAYYQGATSCLNRSTDGEKLHQKLAEYMGSVEAYFMSSYFKKPELQVKSKVELLYAIDKKESLAKIEIGEMPSLHPLFIQAAFQMLTKIYPIGESMNEQTLKEKVRSMQLDERFFLSASQLFRLIPNMECSPMGLWPSANRAAYNSIIITSLRMIKALAPEIEINDYHVQPVGCGEDKYRLPDLYSNSRDDFALALRAIADRYR